MFEVDGLMERPLTRRRVVEVGGALGLAGLAARLLPCSALAQANPANPLGYPEMTVTIEDGPIQVPAQVAAGFTFATLKNASKNGDLVVGWGRLAEGLSKDDVAAAFSAPSPATPTGDDLVTELLKTGKITLIGGPSRSAPGKASSGITKFAEGTHVIFDVFSNRAVFFEVTAAGADAKTEEPKADLTVQLGAMVFVGLDQGVPAGKHLWRIENIDKREHELIIAPLEPGMTADQFKSLLEQFAGEGGSGTPAPGGSETPSPAVGGDNADQPGGGTSIMSAGETTWQFVDLPAGHYAAFCMVPMDWSGPPHAFMGMIKVFDVK